MEEGLSLMWILFLYIIEIIFLRLSLHLFLFSSVHTVNTFSCFTIARVNPLQSADNLLEKL